MLDEGNLEENKGFLCLLIFPFMLDEGKFRRQKRTSLPLIGELCLIKNHRHNYGQYLTTPFRTQPHIRTITFLVFIPQS
jgi:hypothetical protein